jgi:hypothetical protein
MAAGILVILVASSGCATASTSTDVEPLPRSSDSNIAATAPLEWFAENWWPFDRTESGSVGNARVAPLVPFDGRQVPTLDREPLATGGIDEFTDDFAGPIPREGRVDAVPDCWVTVQ